MFHVLRSICSMGDNIIHKNPLRINKRGGPDSNLFLSLMWWSFNKFPHIFMWDIKKKKRRAPLLQWAHYVTAVTIIQLNDIAHSNLIYFHGVVYLKTSFLAHHLVGRRKEKSLIISSWRNLPSGSGESLPRVLHFDEEEHIIIKKEEFYVEKMARLVSPRPSRVPHDEADEMKP